MADVLMLENVPVYIFNGHHEDVSANPNTFERCRFIKDSIAGGSQRGNARLQTSDGHV